MFSLATWFGACVFPVLDGSKDDTIHQHNPRICCNERDPMNLIDSTMKTSHRIYRQNITAGQITFFHGYVSRLDVSNKTKLSQDVNLSLLEKTVTSNFFNAMGFS